MTCVLIDNIGSRLALCGFYLKSDHKWCCEQTDSGFSRENISAVGKQQLLWDQNGYILYKGTDLHAAVAQCRMHAASDC